MFCSLCPLSVRQLIDRINLALTDQSIYPTRMHLLDLIQNDPQAVSFCMAAISPHLPLKKNTDQWRRSLRKVHGFQLAILNHCPGFVRSYVNSTLAARIHRSDSFLPQLQPHAKCMIITHNMMLTWWKNPWSLHIQLRQEALQLVAQSSFALKDFVDHILTSKKRSIDHEILLCQWLSKKEENPNVWKQHLNKNLPRSWFLYKSISQTIFFF